MVWNRFIKLNMLYFMRQQNFPSILKKKEVKISNIFVKSKKETSNVD